MRIKRISTYAAGTALAGMMLASSALADNVIRFVPHADLRLYDPVYSTNLITQIHGYLIFDTLFALDGDGRPQPQMVGDYDISDDSLVYTFTLRDGLLWHDGEPVSSEDVVASLLRWSQRDGLGRRMMTFAESLEAVDDSTFRLTLKEPYGLVIDTLAKTSIHVPFIMPKRLAETDPQEQFNSEDMIGSGPFRFVQEEWSPGSRVVYERFEDYIPRDEPSSFAAGGKVVHVDRVEWHYLPDHATAVAALNAGEVDFFENPPIDLIVALEANPDVVTAVIDPLGIQGTLRPNHIHPPFDNPLARQALLHLTDVEKNLQGAVGNPEYFDVCYSFFMCGVPMTTEVGSDALAEYNPDRARELLEEAGYDFEEPIVVLDATDQSHGHAFALILAQELRDIGAPVELRSADWATITVRRTVKEPPSEGGWNVFFSWWPGAEMSNPLTNLPIDAGGEGSAWWGWPVDEQIQSLRDEWALAANLEERYEIVERLQERLYEFVPYVPIGQFYQPVAYRSNLEGVIHTWSPFFWNVQKN